MYDLSYFYRTVTNLLAPSQTLEDYDADTEVTPSTSSSTSEENRENRVEEDVTEGDTETTPVETSKTGKKKSKTRAQIEREELADKIINFANKEDNPVDLELAALSSKIKRKLPDPDDQDDLLDEIKDLARSYFQRKRRNITTPPTTTSTMMPTPGGATAAVMTQMPPPLQRLGQIQQQEGGGDVIIQQNEYNPTVEYVRDAATGATFMAL